MARKLTKALKVRYNTRELNAISRGMPVEVVGQVSGIRRRLRDDPKLRRKFWKRISESLKTDIRGNWVTGRGYDHYNNLFSRFLGRSIIDELVAMAGKKKKVLRILDSGAGDGFFLGELKHRLREEKGIETKTTALVLKANPVLQKRKEAGNIDALIKLPGEKYIPDEKQDVIFNFFGTMEYGIPEFKKRVLLKEAYSLNKGGLACFGFDIPSSGKEASESFKENVERSFEKRGFSAKFHSSTFLKALGYPKDVLIVRRNI